MRGGAAFPVRLGFTKRGKIRWISHRDVARAFERAFRIERLPLAFSEGFNPHPKVSFGLALSTGHESEAEYLDVELREAVDLGELPGRLTRALPDGLEVEVAVPLVERAPSLQESVTSSDWSVWVTSADGEPIERAVLESAVEALLAADVIEVPKRRKGREGHEDIRPLVGRLVIETGAPGGDASALPGAHLVMELLTQPRSAKPADVLAALRVVAPAIGELREARVIRTQQWVEHDGRRSTPLVAHTVGDDGAGPADRVLVPEARAS